MSLPGVQNATVRPKDLRRLIIEASHEAHVGHVASALSVCDLLSVLFSSILRHPGTRRPDRDRIILSKGHAALALYGALVLAGIHSRDRLHSYCKDGTLMGVHPEHTLEGVEISTGSLGLGLSIGVGMALAARLDRAPERVFVLLSDAECNEGSVWEAVMFSGHHRLSNLVAIVEKNGMQALGPTKDVIDQGRLKEQWGSFGWEVLEVDGHNETQLQTSLELPDGHDRPRLVLANTVPGKGVSFIENRLEWHYLPLSDFQASQALREIARSP
jgi:transketolase